MKTRIIMITTILAMACMVWLLGENRAYEAQYKKQLIKEAELVDQYFDLQVEYEHCFDGMGKMELEMDTLIQYIGELEMLFQDDLVMYKRLDCV
jgi:hypothetical protein